MYERYDFAHDGDLYSFVVKDIVIDKHLRLIGQQTSSQGIFIGPIFYYILIPFFLITSMQPYGVLLFALILGVLTVLSYYFVFRKLFDVQTGLIGAFLQAILLSRVGHDRWVVPTITTSLWEVWFFYVVLMLAKGNFAVFPILGVLIGLIWHISFFLAPILVTIPVAIFLSKKIPKGIDLIKTLIGFLIPSLPLFMFEFRHNFMQTKSLFGSFLMDQGGGTGLKKLELVINQISGNIANLYFYPHRDPLLTRIVFFILLIALSSLLVSKKGLSKKFLVVLYTWIGSMILFFSFSSKIISEYYFSNVDTVFLAFLIIAFSLIFKINKFGKVVVMGVLIILAIKNTYYIINNNEYNFSGYVERKAVADFISADSKSKDYPCVAVSYITTPGNDFGFRYVFYLDNLHVNKPLGNTPIYTIVLPANLAEEAINKHFGTIGVITPQNNYDKNNLQKNCSEENSYLTEPLFGLTK